MSILSLFQIGLALIVVIVVHVMWAKYRIRQWALHNQYSISSCKLCLANIGPFSYFGTSGGQSVFRIEALSADGEMKKGYARAGGYFFGLLRKRVEVKWDKSPLPG